MNNHNLDRGKEPVKHILVMSFCLMLVLCMVSTARAHRVMIFAWSEGGTIYTESKFSGGKKVKGGEIIVYDLNGNKLLEGKTDEKGEFSFKAPKKTGMKIVLMAGMGHRAEWTIRPDDIQDTSIGRNGKTGHEATLKNEPYQRLAESIPVSGATTPDDIQIAIEKAMEKELRPVLKMLAELREQGPSVSDILGGIGYILGLMGVGAYFNYRHKLAEVETKMRDKA